IESSPPVRETTFNLPGILRPLLSRSTAGVGSAKCTLVARKRGCDGGRDFIPAPNIQISNNQVRNNRAQTMQDQVSATRARDRRLRKGLTGAGYRFYFPPSTAIRHLPYNSSKCAAYSSGLAAEPPPVKPTPPLLAVLPYPVVMAINFIRSSAISSSRRDPAPLAVDSSMSPSPDPEIRGISSSSNSSSSIPRKNLRQR